MRAGVRMSCCAVLASALHALAQAPAAVPLPAPLLSAHQIFLGNAGPMDTTFSHEAYDAVYRALSGWNQYQLVSDPALAQLSFETHLQKALGDVTNGSSFNALYLQITIFDVKTHSLLWSVSENVKGAVREKSLTANIDDAAVRVVDDLKVLVAAAQPGSAVPASPDPLAAKRFAHDNDDEE